MNAQTAAILLDELDAYEALGWKWQCAFGDGRVRVIWHGHGPAPHPEQGAPTCGNGCSCVCCTERESNVITAAYLRLDPSAWPALEEQVRARLEAART